MTESNPDMADLLVFGREPVYSQQLVINQYHYQVALTILCVRKRLTILCFGKQRA